MESEKPFIKKFKTEKNYYIYDVNTNEILNVDEITYEIIDDYRVLNKNEIIDKYKDKYRNEEIERIYALIDKNANENNYFLSFRLKGLKWGFSKEELSKMLKSELKQIILNVTEKCNMRCKYCVYSGKYLRQRTHSLKTMTFALAKKTIEYFINNSSETVTRSITFYGGEPLLAFNLIKKIIDYVKLDLKISNVHFNLTTNGTLLNETIIKYFIKNNVSLLISLDGPKRIHDYSRTFRNGSGTFDLIIKNLKKIKAMNEHYYRQQIGFNATLSPPYCIDEVVKFFHSFYLTKKNNTMISDIDPSYTTFFDDYNKEILDQQNTKYRKWMIKNSVKALSDHNIDSYPLFSAFLYKNLYPWFHRSMSQIKEFVSPNGHCIIGQRKFLVSTTGDFYICDKVDHSIIIGNVETGLDVDKIFNLHEDICHISEKACCKCWCIRICPICIRSKLNEKKLSSDFIHTVCNNIRASQEKILSLFCSIMESDQKALENMFQIYDKNKQS